MFDLFIEAGPQKSKRRNINQESARLPQFRPELPQNRAIVCDVLQYIQGENEFK
jgi:hypothetical protein